MAHEFWELEIEIDTYYAETGQPFKGLREFMLNWCFDLQEGDLDNDLEEFDIFIDHGIRYIHAHYPGVEDTERDVVRVLGSWDACLRRWKENERDA